MKMPRLTIVFVCLVTCSQTVNGSTNPASELTAFQEVDWHRQALFSDSDRSSGESENLSLIGRIPDGPCRSCAADGPLAAYGNGGWLTTADISNPNSPVEMGRVALPGPVEGLTIHGYLAYVANGEAGIRVVDISNPTAPQEIGSYEFSDDVIDVKIGGAYAYVAASSAGLAILDVSDPAHPQEVSVSDTPGSARGVFVAGNLAYVADYDQGLLIFNVTDPTNPVLASVTDTPGYAYKIAVNGTYAYVADSSEGLRIYNISNPTAPYVVGVHDTSGYTYGVSLSGNYAYIADFYAVRIIDVSNPASPVEMGYFSSSYALDVTVSGVYAYASYSEKGLKILDVSNPANPTQAATLLTSGAAQHVTVHGDFVYLVDNSGLTKLHVIDISDPCSPIEVGSTGGGGGTGVAVNGSFVYVTNYGSSMSAINVGDPEAPFEAGSIATPGLARGVDAQGIYAYVAADDAGLRIIDVSDPGNLYEIGFIEAGIDAQSVAVEGDYAYVLATGAYFYIIDVSNPANPTQVGSAITGGGYDIAVSNNFVYVVGNVYMRIFDASDPSNPFTVSQFYTPDASRSVVIENNFAYLSSEQAGLLAVDISDPSNPIQAGFYNTGGSAFGVASYASLVFVADWSDGLWIFQNDLLAPPVISSIQDIPEDQGRQVRITWDKTIYDAPGDFVDITSYAIFRRQDDSKCDRFPAPDRSVKDPGLTFPRMAGWDFLGTVPAFGEDVYQYVAPTLCDSTLDNGICWSVFFVRAMTPDPFQFYDSPPDSGYSVDNLAPSAPMNLLFAPPGILTWDEAPEEDFNYFTVYGSTADIFNETADLIAHTTDLEMDVQANFYPYYHVTATDFAGNKGEAATTPNLAGGWTDVTAGPLGNTGTGAGVAWGDCDNDPNHLVDLHLVNEGQANRLYHNEGNGIFADITTDPLDHPGNGTGAYWGDYDNDGDLDLYLLNAGEANVLFRNIGGCTFTDATSGVLADPGNAWGAAWVDHDNDGFIDLYISNEGQPNLLIQNENGLFSDQTPDALNFAGNSQGASWGDYDNDGDQDLYLVVADSANRLFRNNGDGQFEDVTLGPLADAGPGQGAAWGDYDNDGNLDLYITNWNGPNVLLHNAGGGTFSDATTLILANAGNGQSAVWGDYDNDTDLDLYLANYGQANKLFRNEGGGVFVDDTGSVVGDTENSVGAAFADMDSDGDLDLYVANANGPNRLYRNNMGSENHWLHVRLVGTLSNRSAIGARVKISTGDVHQIREVTGGSGYLSQNSLLVEFGLGTETIVDTVQVIWPQRLSQGQYHTSLLTDVAANQVLEIVEIDDPLAGIDDTEDLPTAYALHGCFPNPFNPMTTIRYELPVASRVQLKVFDAAGHLIDTLISSDFVAAGRHEVVWNGLDSRGQTVASGIYFCRLDAGEFVDTIRMVMVR